MASPVLVVHGGAGPLPSSAADPEAAAARCGIGAALAAGWRVLEGDGAARRAVVAAVAVLEDDPVFNAGRGSVLSAEGGVEMDAALMDGALRRAGAVAGLRRVAHPVEAALAVMEQSPHVLLAGPAAEAFAARSGCRLVEPESLVTPQRRAQLSRSDAGTREARETVGAVALDAAGHLAAATSTGGLVGKLPGRVSDSCLVGAGTWADDATCAVSGTGPGELFIRCAFAHEVDARMRHAGEDLEAACRGALAALSALGGRGGCIALDATGRRALAFDTPAMPRGWIAADGEPHVMAV